MDPEGQFVDAFGRVFTKVWRSILAETSGRADPGGNF